MFTGIIKGLGRVLSVSGLGNIYGISVEASAIAPALVIGDSVAVDGVCLTLTQKKKDALSFDVMAETMKRTTLGRLKPGDSVNIEDALRAGGPIGGHFVTGHVDCVGKIRDIRRSSAEVAVEISFPEEYSKLTADKGSITIDGISLTIGKAAKGSIVLYIIPHTLKMTTLGSRRAGDSVNIEFDLLSKYISGTVK
jgi:riboflavin synthase